MGMSSSQARLLTLTARMHDIEYKAAKIEAQKLQLGNDSRRVYEEYLNALDLTKIQYKSMNTDGSIMFKDATLASLENGLIKGYTGETSAKNFLLKDIATGKIYMTKDYAASLGITNSEDLFNGTLEEWLIQNNAPTKTETYISSQREVDNLEDVKSIVKNGTLPTYTDASYDGFDKAVVNPTTNYPDELIAGKTYIVNTAKDLAHISKLINDGQTSKINIVLGGEINMSGLTGENSFQSINNFKGNFDGNGYKIKGLTTALFDTISAASGYGEIKNVTLEDVSITGRSDDCTGALANKATNCKISKIEVSGNIESDNNYVGGLIGKATNSTISYCSVENINVKGREVVGGFIGISSNSTIENCKVSTSTSSNKIEATRDAVGGFCGQIVGGSITNCYSDCYVYIANDSGGNRAGGFCGFASGEGAVIDNCQADGILKLNTTSRSSCTAGGFLGSCGNMSLIEDVSDSHKVSIIIKNSQSNVTITSDDSLNTPGFAGFAGVFDYSIDSTPETNSLTLENCSFNGSVSNIDDSYAYGFVNHKEDVENSSLVITDCSSIYMSPNGYTSDPSYDSGMSGGDGAGTTVNWTMPTQGSSEIPTDAIDVKLLGAAEQQAVVSIKDDGTGALFSNIRAVLIKSGDYDPSGRDSGNTTIEKNIKIYLQSFNNEAHDNTNLYYLNEEIVNYLKAENAAETPTITALINDIKGGKEKKDSDAIKTSSIASQAVISTIQRASYKAETDNWSPVYHPTVEGDYDIPNTETLKKNMKAVFTKFGIETDNIDTFFGKYDTSEQDLAYLARINDMLASALSSGSAASLNDLKSKVASGERYEPSGAVDITKYNIRQSLSGDPEYNKKTEYEYGTREVINYDHEDTKALIAAYEAMKCGVIIIGDDKTPGMDKSTEWLTNVINGGYAVLHELDFTKAEKTDIETSVAINTHLQEVSDEKDLRKAEAKYEADMKRIDMKDRRYDTELAAVDTERNAIKQEMETLKTVARDNVERTFKLFS